MLFHILEYKTHTVLGESDYIIKLKTKEGITMNLIKHKLEYIISFGRTVQLNYELRFINLN